MLYVHKVIFLWLSLTTFVDEVSSVKRWLKVRANRRRFQSAPRLRVLQGWPDVNDNYPFVVVFLEKNDDSDDRTLIKGGSGSLITNQWVLTAAHCKSENIRYIRYGNMTVNWGNSKCKSKVLKMFSFPAYGGGEHAMNNIGLVLTDVVETKSLGRIHSADYKTFLGRSARYAGFGSTYPSYIHSPLGEDKAKEEDDKRELQIGEGVIFNDHVSDLDEIDYLPKISVAPKCSNIHQAPYFGDSGGPLFVDNKIVGVLSRGNTDHTESITFQNAKHPDHASYTPVSPYLNWIKHTMNKN